MTAAAQTLLSAFSTKAIDDTKVVINPDHEHADTVRAMVFAADQSGLGWDFAYEAVRDALAYLCGVEPESPESDDERHDFANSAVDVYSADRIAWLASSPIKHMQLCNDAAAESGESYSDIAEFIGIGQYHAYTLAYAAVAANWPDDEDDSDDDTDDEDDSDDDTDA